MRRTTAAPATGAVLSTPTWSTGAIGPRRTSTATPVKGSIGPVAQAAAKPRTRPRARMLRSAPGCTNRHDVQVEVDPIGNPYRPAGSPAEWPDPEVGLQYRELGFA